MVQVSKEDLISQYIDYKINSYKVGFNDAARLDRVEKILSCHGWLTEAEKVFQVEEKVIREKRALLKSRLIEAFKNCDLLTASEIEEKINPP